MNSKSFIMFLLLILLQIVVSAEIRNSKHDLSATNEYGNFYGEASTEICVFCHTPHAANSSLTDGNPGQAPIWNRRVTDDTKFELYTGSYSVPTGPTPSPISVACLSCHDGVSATGGVSAVASNDVHVVINTPGSGSSTALNPNCSACHPFARPEGGELYPSAAWQIGADLTDDHPVSINYQTSYSHFGGGTADAEFEAVPLNGVKLFNDKVECASCHDVHDGNADFFLRAQNSGSGFGSKLCKSCHIK